MKTRAVVIAILGLLTIAVASYAYIAVTPPTEPDNRQIQQVKSKYEDGPPTAEELLELVNAEREKVGVAPLAIKDALTQSAQWKADDMAARNYFAHTDPDTGKNNGLDYFFSIDDTCRNVSEDLSWNTDKSQLSAVEAVNWWKSSKAHYAAMINPRYTTTGFGISNHIITEHFCIAR